MADIWFTLWRTFAVIEALMCVIALVLGLLGVADAWGIAGRTGGEACVCALLGWPGLQPRRVGRTLSVRCPSDAEER